MQLRSTFLAPPVALLLLALAACGSDDPAAPPADGTATPPTVSSTSPVDGATAIPRNGTINVSFSEAMDPATITVATFTLQQGSTPVAGAVSSVGVTATFAPSGALAADTLYAATVTTGAKDLDSEALASSHTWSFTTGATTDTTAPTVLYTDPVDGAADVALNRSVVAAFSEPINATTLSAESFTLSGPDSTPIAGTLTYAGTRATFTPLVVLAPSTLFRAAVSASVKDLAGNALASERAWSFTTSATTSLGPAPVVLGLAGGYVILAKSGIDTVPASAITGNIGVSPIDSTAVVGFSLALDASNEFATSDQVTGEVRAADYAEPTPSRLTTAVSDMETAYTDAAGRPDPDFAELGAGEIGGLTLAPGLYKWGTGVAISTDVTLAGGPNDVWIFQISGDVTQANGVRVNLSGGALPKNIFWQTFGQVSVGTNAHFEGVVLCQTAIVLGTGATLNGRLLAQTAVTLDQNAVTEPAE